MNTMADDPPIELSPSPSPAPVVVPPPVEAWISYPTGNLPQNHPMILNALSDDGWWNGYALNQWVDGGWWENKGDKIAEIIRGAVLDFREAYGAAFDVAAKDDATLVPTSCLAYIEATVHFNICLRFDLYNLLDDGLTRYQVKDFFEQAWKDAAIYRRHIAVLRKLYREDLTAVSVVEGEPVYFARKHKTGRCT